MSFPSNYFPDHYFAPRYWPKHGLTPPGIIRVLMNGIEVTDRVWYGQPANWNNVRGSRGTSSVAFVVEPGERFEVQVGESMEIYDPASDRVWFGNVEAVGRKWLDDSGWRVIIATGISKEALYDTVDVDKVKYAGVSCAFAFDDLVDRANVAGIGKGTIAGDTIIESLEVGNVAQGFEAIALLCGHVWYVDPLDGRIYLHPPMSRPAAWEVASENILWESIDWTQSRADVRTSQVVQLPGVSLQPITATFDGDDSTTAFNLPSIPEYVISIVINIGSTGRAISWFPGTTIVGVVPALPVGATLTVRYADEGLVAETTTPTAIGAKTALYTRTRSFTPEGGLQEAAAILARYSMLPAQLRFSTDKPGIRVGRLLTIAAAYPQEASMLNGEWMVKEVDATMIPGVDQLQEPFGHFRYTLRLVNTAATAVFQGDGTTTQFVLPVDDPTDVEVTDFRTNAEGRTGTWFPELGYFGIVPALGVGDSAAVDYRDPLNAPDVPSFIQTWEDLADPNTDPPVVLSSDPPGEVLSGGGGVQTFRRTLTIYDSTVRNDAAPHTPVDHDGTALRLLGVLTREIDSDLTVRINKGPVGAVEELITVTIPGSALVDDVFEWSLATGSPATLGPFFDKEVLTADILDSDGDSHEDGIAQFTVQWIGPLESPPEVEP